jgi:hypothetical protein
MSGFITLVAQQIVHLGSHEKGDNGRKLRVVQAGEEFECPVDEAKRLISRGIAKRPGQDAKPKVDPEAEAEAKAKADAAAKLLKEEVADTKKK